MNAFLQKAANFYDRFHKRKQNRKAELFMAKYIKKNNLQELLNSVNSLTTSTGTDLYDYVSLHSYITKHQPHYILECGTGKSTWIIADALKKNKENFGIIGKVISMESVEQWYNEAKAILPERFGEQVEIHYSPATTYMYYFIRGTVYSKVPDYPYDMIFVDGPELDVTENGISHEGVNLDLIKYIQTTTSDKRVTALVDARLRTCIAYGNIFGLNKVKFLKPWNLGIVENINKDDLLLGCYGIKLTNLLKQNCNLRYDSLPWTG